MEWRREGVLPGRAAVLALTDERSRARRAAWGLMRRGVTLVVVLGLMLLSPGAQQFVVAQAQPDPHVEALARLDRFMELIEELRDQIDRTQFDVDALSLELAFEEPETIVAWVRENIAFEQYPGLLRGAQGTLMSRAGNALDQAVLLATLLKDAGFEAQIVHARLTAGQAEDLLAGMGRDRPQVEPVHDIEQARESFVNLVGVSGLEPSATEEFRGLLGLGVAPDPATYAAALDDADMILAEIERHGEEIGSPDAMGGLIEEARDYYWVEYRTALASEWIGAHPALDGEPWDGLSAGAVFTDSVPAALQHRFRFQVFIERKLGDTLEVVPVSSVWERPSANLVGVPMTYLNYPTNAVDVKSLEDLEAVLENSEGFLPVFNGDLAPGALAFTLEGFAVDPVAARDQAAGLFETVGSSFGRAAGALDSLGGGQSTDPDDFVALSASWIEFTMIAPGGEETSFERYVLDRVGAEHRSRGVTDILDAPLSDLKRTLMTQQTFMLAPGTYPAAYILDRSLNKLVEMQEFLAASVGVAFGSDLDAELLSSLGRGSTGWLGHLRLYSVFDLGANAGDRIVYRPEPSLVVYRERFTSGNNLEVTVDVVKNIRRSFTMSEGEYAFDWLGVVQAGAWETHTEGIAISSDLAVPAATIGTFRAAREEAIPIRTFAPGDGAALEDLALPEEAMQNLRQDLARGYLVVVPERLPVSAASDFGWWRVHLETGETLGVASDGRGEVSAETLIIWITVIAGVLIVVSFLKVLSCYSGQEEASWDCILCNGSGMVFGGVALATVSKDPRVGLGILLSDLLFQAACAIYAIGAAGPPDGGA